MLRVLHNAVAYYTEAGRLGMAAKQLRVSALSRRMSLPFANKFLGLPWDITFRRPCLQVAMLCMQEVAETMEKQNLKEESIEFYNQVPKIPPRRKAQRPPLSSATSCCKLSCLGRSAIRPNVTPACAGS